MPRLLPTIWFIHIIIHSDAATLTTRLSCTHHLSRPSSEGAESRVAAFRHVGRHIGPVAISHDSPTYCDTTSSSAANTQQAPHPALLLGRRGGSSCEEGASEPGRPLTNPDHRSVWPDSPIPMHTRLATATATAAARSSQTIRTQRLGRCHEGLKLSHLLLGRAVWPSSVSFHGVHSQLLE
jgi:hypothetical protein